jgi:hypothetical protein
MVFRIPVAALSLLVVVLAAFAGACGEGTSGEAATPTSTPSPQSSARSTAEARETLRAFFAAWQAKDVAALKSYLPADRQGGNWEFEGLDRVEFGKITESPEQIEGYLTNGHGLTSGVSPDDVRCFQADVTFFYKPGYQGSADEGQALAWHWFLERNDEGNWIVADQGF